MIRSVMRLAPVAFVILFGPTAAYAQADSACTWERCMLVATRPLLGYRITAGTDQRVVASFVLRTPPLPVLGSRSPAAERTYQRFRSERTSGTLLAAAGSILLNAAVFLALDAREGPASTGAVLGVGGILVGAIQLRRSERSLARALDLYNATLRPLPR